MFWWIWRLTSTRFARGPEFAAQPRPAEPPRQRALAPDNLVGGGGNGEGASQVRTIIASSVDRLVAEALVSRCAAPRETQSPGSRRAAGPPRRRERRAGTPTPWPPWSPGSIAACSGAGAARQTVAGLESTSVEAQI